MVLPQVYNSHLLQIFVLLDLFALAAFAFLSALLFYTFEIIGPHFGSLETVIYCFSYFFLFFRDGVRMRDLIIFLWLVAGLISRLTFGICICIWRGVFMVVGGWTWFIFEEIECLIHS